METLTVERDRPVLRVWLDRPEKRNPLSGVTLQARAEIYEGVGSDFDVKVVVLGGRGPSFSGGADRKDPGAPRAATGEPTARERRWASQLGKRATRAIDDCEV